MGGVDVKTGRNIRHKGPALDEQTFEIIRRRITAASGIYVPTDENSRFVLERRLAPRLRIRGLTSYADYEAGMDERELDAVLDVVAIHETYFFREKRQLKVFAERVLPELASRHEPIRIWSAGCSTGEEPYTVAMLLAECGLLASDRASLYASDLSRRVVDFAVRGVYPPSSFRTTDSYFKDKFFEEAGGDLWRASALLREFVSFEQLNLMNLDGRVVQSMAGGERFHVIFCRNVLMYFDPDAVKRSLAAFHSLLEKGGYLLLGHAESLLPLGSSFEAVPFGRELVHRK